MGCGCGSSKRELTRSGRATPIRSSGYQLATYPGCASTYVGPNEGDSILIVGRNTPEERLYSRKLMREAEAYAQETRALIENLPTTGLCAQAVVDTLGA